MIGLSRWIGLVATLLLAPNAVFAQAPVESFADLASVLKPGSEVTVTDNDGKRTAGTVTELQSDSVTILTRSVPAQKRSYSEADIALIDHKTSRWPFIALGSGAGVLLMELALINTGSPEAGDMVAGAGLIGGGLGAALGFVLHAAAIHERTYYQKNHNPQVELTPTFSRRRQGLSLTVTF